MAEHGIWMPIYWGDYLGKTSHLSAEEHGVYLLLIAAYWQRGKPLPDDDQYLSTASRLSRKRWKMVRQKISEFFAVSEGVWTHRRVEKELLSSCDRISAGKAGAYARWHAVAMPSTTTKKIESSFNGNGPGNGHTIPDPKNRLAIFQKKLAIDWGCGWELVGIAANPDHPGYKRALEACQQVARRNGKGWPHQWPK